jgi:hypothetical protein
VTEGTEAVFVWRRVCWRRRGWPGVVWNSVASDGVGIGSVALTRFRRRGWRRGEIVRLAAFGGG